MVGSAGSSPVWGCGCAATGHVRALRVRVDLLRALGESHGELRGALEDLAAAADVDARVHGALARAAALAAGASPESLSQGLGHSGGGRGRFSRRVALSSRLHYSAHAYESSTRPCWFEYELCSHFERWCASLVWKRPGLFQTCVRHGACVVAGSLMAGCHRLHVYDLVEMARSKWLESMQGCGTHAAPDRIGVKGCWQLTPCLVYPLDHVVFVG
eukprot:353072-Chlamydomonas_euryale.AAC.14